jgi:hypothetical protein
MEKKHLGKIDHVEFGLGGYQDAMFGLTLSFSFDGCGIGTFISGGWNNSIKVSEYTKWTEEDRNRQRAEMCEKVNQLLLDAKVNSVHQLGGKPVEITIENSTFKDFRILKEVL